MQSAVVS